MPYNVNYNISQMADIRKVKGKCTLIFVFKTAMEGSTLAAIKSVFNTCPFAVSDFRS